MWEGGRAKYERQFQLVLTVLQSLGPCVLPAPSRCVHIYRQGRFNAATHGAAMKGHGHRFHTACLRTKESQHIAMSRCIWVDLVRT